jgi:BirA family biotin operon repressor/biotin-[acetyl-CoA-carboxylase] ligase
VSRPSASVVDALLETAWLGRAWRYLEQCASTNDEAAAWLAAEGERAAPHGAVVVAETQTGGRGRAGHSWYSPPDNLYLSVALRPPPTLEPRALPPLTLAAAVALAGTVAGMGAEPELKWPNDVLVEGRKLGGVLTESSCQGARVASVIIGIGVNLNQRTFPDELAGRATSLSLVTGQLIDRAAFAASLCRRLERWYDTFIARGPAPVIAAWRRHGHMLGQPVTVQVDGAPLAGTADDLEPDGALRLRTADGRTVRVVAGEVTLAEGVGR